MADSLISILTRRLTRNQLRQFLGDDHDLIKTFENIFTDVTQTIPDNINSANGVRVSLSENTSLSNNGYSAPLGMLIPMKAKLSYLISGIFTFQSGDIVPPLQLGFTCPDGATVSGKYGNNIDISPISDPLFQPGAVTPSGRIWVITGSWIINNPNVDGAAQLRAKTITSLSTAVLLAGRCSLVANTI